MKLPEFRVVLAMFLFNMVGFDLVQVVLIFFLKHVIKVSDDLVFIFMAIPLVTAVLSAPLWIALGQKWGKKNAFIVAAVYLFVSFLLCLVVPEGGVVFMGVLCAFAGVGVSASQVIPFSIIPDVIEIDEYRNGTRREGAFYGVTMFLYKAASAIAINIATLFLAAFGYMEATAGQNVGEVIQPDSAVWAIRILMGTGPGVCFLVAAAFVRKLSITKERFEEVKLALEERNKR
jgi:GPH family glycoside/pentoside/hexuronide:cation symporter